jgi:hypothetical protein
MPDYLSTPNNVVALAPSQYAGMYTLQLGHPLRPTDFHIQGTNLTTAGPFPHQAPNDCGTQYRFKDVQGSSDFDDFYPDWLMNNALLYRGISGNHFSWDRIKGSFFSHPELKSEGTADIPTYTMGNEQPTAWLPTDMVLGTAVNVALGNMDQFTAAKSNTASVPVGIVASIRVGKSLGKPICYLNPGETVVKGPLRYPAFGIHQLVWLEFNGITNSNWLGGLAPDKLMPVRPYKPASQGDFDAWWNGGDMQTWRREVSHAGGTVTYTPSPSSWQNLGGFFGMSS